MAQQTKTPPAPVSLTVQLLLEQIHAEAKAEALDEISARDKTVILKAMPMHGRRAGEFTSRGFQVRTRDGSQFLFLIDHADRDFSDTPLIGPRWSAHTTLLDDFGRRWAHSEYFLITDDFGDLVQGDCAI